MTRHRQSEAPFGSLMTQNNAASHQPLSLLIRVIRINATAAPASGLDPGISAAATTGEVE